MKAALMTAAVLRGLGGGAEWIRTPGTARGSIGGNSPVVGALFGSSKASALERICLFLLGLAVTVLVKAQGCDEPTWVPTPKIENLRVGLNAAGRRARASARLRSADRSNRARAVADFGTIAAAVGAGEWRASLRDRRIAGGSSFRPRGAPGGRPQTFRCHAVAA